MQKPYKHFVNNCQSFIFNFYNFTFCLFSQKHIKTSHKSTAGLHISKQTGCAFRLLNFEYPLEFLAVSERFRQLGSVLQAVFDILGEGAFPVAVGFGFVEGYAFHGF